MVWFDVENAEVTNDLCSDENKHVLPPPPAWLVESAYIDNDGVDQYVLASAMESLAFYCNGSDLFLEDVMTSWSGRELRMHDLMIESASQGNSDASNRLACLCRNEEMSTARCKQMIGSYLNKFCGLRLRCEETHWLRWLWETMLLKGVHLASSTESIVMSSVLHVYALTAQQGEATGVLALTHV